MYSNPEMKEVFACVLLCLMAAVIAQPICECPDIDPEVCECGVVSNGCCTQCCTECTQCFADPCKDYSCGGYPGYTCKANYCGGCNREWFTSQGEPVECEFELQGESACALVDCMPPEMLECENSCGTTKGDSCCEHCCDLPCVECFVDPCDGAVCSGHPELSCQSNYCGGCNRDWFNADGIKVTCPMENDNNDWNVDCERNSDCLLKNTDYGWDCCSLGDCAVETFAGENWKAINAAWWISMHSQNCQEMMFCPAIACLDINVKPDYSAQCVNRKCEKIRVQESRSDQSSSASLLGVGLVLFGVVVLNL